MWRFTSTDALWQDLRYAVRMLFKKPGFTALAMLALTLGIGANTAVFSVVNAVLLRPLPYEDSDRLMWLSETGEQVANRFISYPNFLDWRERNQVFEAMSTFRGLALTFTGAGEPETIDARMVSADYFSVMRVKPFLGRDFLPEEDKPGASAVTVLSYGFWQQRFGADESIIGKTITLDNRAFTVVGVMPRSFQHQGPPPLWVLMGQWTGQDNWMQRDVRVAGYVIARLKPGVTLASARANMDAISEDLIRQYPWHNAGHSIRIVSLYESVVGDIRPSLLILLGAVGFVLLIACANVANLLLARAATRQKEFAIRAALGASRLRIIRQLLTESVLLALMGGASGLLLAWWTVGLLVAADPDGVPRLGGVGIDRRVLFFSVALSMLTGIIFGLAPALETSKRGVYEKLKENSGTVSENRGGTLRSALVVAEVAFALVLLVGAGLLIKSFSRLLEANPGFDPKNVITMQISLPRPNYPDKAQVNRFHKQLLERVGSLPGVEAASVLNTLPGLSDGWQTDIAIEGRPPINPGEEIQVDWGIVSADYFSTMKIPILRGRPFSQQEAQEGLPVVIVDENLARRYWPDADALGKRIRYDSPTPHEIIGIAANVSNYGSEAQSRIKIYTPLNRGRLNRATLAVRAINPESQAMVAALTREIHALDKELSVSEIETMEQILARRISARRFNTILLGVFAGVALTLSSLGIYGVVSYSVSRRTREIGIRMALGAQQSEVLRLVIGHGMILALIGIAAGLVAAFALTRVLSSLLYGVSATDMATFAGVSMLLAAVALIACYIPARKATKVDPLVALRYE